jgi:YebC/PmpR family DNA-binding regulatory protein
MSRHSKWAKIKRQKTVTDVHRGQIFTKLSRAITVAAREGGGDPATNVRLRIALDRALAENMPKENTQRAIERAVGTDADRATESLTLEGYGPGGTALIIEAVTDNHNRTVGEIRRLLLDAGGSLGGAGSTQWMFDRRGRLLFEHPQNQGAVELAAIDAGALDVSRDGAAVEILTPPETLHTIADTMVHMGYRPDVTEITLVPHSPVILPSPEEDRLQTLLENLEDHADVVDVTTNAVPLSPGTAHADSRH